VITVRDRALPDRVRRWSVWLIDAGLDTTLLVGFVRGDLLPWVARTGEGPTDLRAGFRDRREAIRRILIEGGFAQEPKAPVPVKRMAASARRLSVRPVAPGTARPSSFRRGAASRGRARTSPKRHHASSRRPTKPTIRRAAYRAALRVRRASLQLDLADAGCRRHELGDRPALLAMIQPIIAPSSVAATMTTKCHGRRDRAASFLEMDIQTRRHIRNYYEMGWPNPTTFDHESAPNSTVNPRRSDQMT
jgi:hypothetical protein